MGRNDGFFLILRVSALLGSLGFWGMAMAYPTPIDVDGSLHVWPITAEAPTVYYEIVVTDEALRPAITIITTASAKLWTDVHHSALTLAPAPEGTVPQITLYFDNSIDGGDMAAGYTLFDQVENDKPVHCSIHIAANSNSIGNLDKTTLHELGHSIGLGHSLIPRSIMSYELGVNEFALSIDDEAAISRLYPTDSNHSELAPGCSINGTSQHPGNRLLWLLFLFAPWPLSFLRIALQNDTRIV